MLIAPIETVETWYNNCFSDSSFSDGFQDMQLSEVTISKTLMHINKERIIHQTLDTRIIITPSSINISMNNDDTSRILFHDQSDFDITPMASAAKQLCSIAKPTEDEDEMNTKLCDLKESLGKKEYGHSLMLRGAL